MTRLNGVMFRRCTVALAFVLGACGSAEAVETDPSAPPTATPTVPGVGRLPDAIPFDESERDSEEPMVSVVVTRPVDRDGVVVESVAERVNGNRLLVIGDSILASTASRYGGELCDALNPIGWSVEVNAEPGRFIPFGNEVAEARLDVDDEDFDAVVIHLGSNYGRDKDEYFEQLSELLYRTAPRPTLLLTVTEYRPQWSEVNEVIDELARLYDNVTVIDWGKIARAPGVLSRDGLHPGSQGEAVLVKQIAVALGELDTDDAECLRSSFTDDSAVNRGGGSSGSSSGGSSSGGSSSGGSSSGGTTSGTTGTTTSGGTTGVTTTDGSSGGGSTGGDTTDGSTGVTTTDGSSGGGSTGGDTTDGSTGVTTTDGSSSGGGSTGGDTTDGSTGVTTTDGSSGGDSTGGSSGGSAGTTVGSTTGSTATTVAAATDGSTETG